MQARRLRRLCWTLFCLALLTACSVSSAQGPKLQMAPSAQVAVDPLPPRTGFVPPPVDLSHLTGQDMPAGTSIQAVPASWDWRTSGKVTPVKDQGACGSCYAFASLGNLESKVLIGNAGTYDFSENNAKECNWEQTSGGGSAGSCNGGNYFMVANLLSQKGTVLETCDPYSTSNVSCNSGCPYQKTLLDWRIISGNSVPNTAVLKQYIYDHGPVYVSMYAGNGDAWESELQNYDGSYTMYYAGTQTTNHAVLIVGWNDSLTHAGGSGAWIVKNSWGTNWGGTCGYGSEKGYFTIAYGSASIGKYASFAETWQNYDSSGSLMYYDEAGWSNAFGCGSTTVYGLAKFVPSSNTRVTRVEFWTTDRTTDIDIDIYDSFNGTTPSTLLASKHDVPFEEAGYHSVALNTPLNVTTGNDVIVVVKFANASYTYPLAVDTRGAVQTGVTYASCSGSEWEDVGSGPYYANAGIRLRTSPQAAPSVSSITPIFGTNAGTVHITNLAGSNFQTGATVKLTRSGQSAINATNVVRVSATQITCDLNLAGAAIGKWNVVVTNPDAQSGTLTDGFTVNPSAPAPTLSSITPNSGTNARTLHITNLAGTGFQIGATVKLTRSGQSPIHATNSVVISATQITCDLDLIGAATGQWNVVVTNPDTQSGTLANGFTVNSSPTAPIVTSIAPNTGTDTGTVHITNLAGSRFQAGAVAKLTRTGYTPISATNMVVTTTKIMCDFNLVGVSAGQWNVMVTNPNGESGLLANGFSIEGHVYLPLVLKNYGTGPTGGIVNGNFEQGPTGWVEYSTNDWDIIVQQFAPGVSPHGGSWAAWLGGDDLDTSYVQQQVVVPAGTPYLAYWHWIASADYCGYDYGGVIINGSTVVDVYDLCDSTNTGGWVKHVVNLGAYAGQSVSLQIQAETDESENSNLFVDDVSFQASPTSAEGIPVPFDPDSATAKSGIPGIRQGGRGESTDVTFLLRSAQ